MTIPHAASPPRPTSIVVEGNLTQDVRRPDGSLWPMALTVDSNRTVFGETPGSLLAHLIPDYDRIPSTEEGHTEALLARWRSAVATCTDVQSLICADRVKEGRFDPSQETEEALTALLGDRTVPVEEISTWDNQDVPIVLIATDYAPFTERTPVTGHVLWLDPSDETAYLHSLSNLGVVDFYVNETADEDDATGEEPDETA